MTQKTVTLKDLDQVATALSIALDRRDFKKALSDALGMNVHYAYASGSVSQKLADATRSMMARLKSGAVSATEEGAVKVSVGGARATAQEAAEGFDNALAFSLDDLDDAEVLEMQNLSFASMRRQVDRLMRGRTRGILISGPGGVGKTYPVMGLITDYIDAGKLQRHNFVKMSGTSSVAELYKRLCDVAENGLLLIDDCDAILEDADCLNLLKVATDSTGSNVITYNKNGKALAKEGYEMECVFRGRVIIITNLDVQGEIERGTKRAAHLEALTTRFDGVDIDIRTQRELMVRIKHMVLDRGMLDKTLSRLVHTTEEQREKATEVVDFMDAYKGYFKTLSLREAEAVAKIYVDAHEESDVEAWKIDALMKLSTKVGAKAAAIRYLRERKAQ